ncbi:5-hydroxyisourate hydrolase-like [Loxodonta africana]
MARPVDRAEAEAMTSGAASRLRRLQGHLGASEASEDTGTGLQLPATQGSGMEPPSSPLTTHVLDTTSGLPARGLSLSLSRLEGQGQQWMELRKSYTNTEGRYPGLLEPGQMKGGTYKLFFDTEGYWKQGQESFYPYVEVVFTITNETQRFHMPLLLSPWSYTTYRGS